MGNTIKEDHLFYNLFQAGVRYTFRGIQLIVYSLVGKPLFEKYTITPTEVQSMDTMCDFTLDVDDEWTQKFFGRNK